MAARFMLIFFVGTILAVVIATAPGQTEAEFQARSSDAAAEQAEQKRVLDDEQAAISRSLAAAARIPVVQARATAEPKALDKGSKSGVKTQKSPPQEAVRTIKVRKGDSLTRIALREYGTAKKMNLIYEANRSKIPDKDNLKVGMTLVVPNRPKR